MKLDFDSEMRDRIVKALRERRIPMEDIEDVVTILRQLQPLKLAPVRDEPAQQTAAPEPNE